MPVRAEWHTLFVSAWQLRWFIEWLIPFVVCLFVLQNKSPRCTRCTFRSLCAVLFVTTIWLIVLQTMSIDVLVSLVEVPRYTNLDCCQFPSAQCEACRTGKSILEICKSFKVSFPDCPRENPSNTSIASMTTSNDGIKLSYNIQVCYLFMLQTMCLCLQQYTSRIHFDCGMLGKTSFST